MPNKFSENPTCSAPDDSEAAQAERSRQLTQLAKLWPEEFEDQSEAGLLRLLAKLRKALREERRRGIAGHWTYSVTRHKALLDTYRQEAGRLMALKTRKVKRCFTIGKAKDSPKR